MEEDLSSILPTPEEILDTVERWRSCYKQIEVIVQRADKILEERENKKKDQGKWKYQVGRTCCNELCSEKATASYNCCNEHCPESYTHPVHCNICTECFPNRKAIKKRLKMYMYENWQELAERATKAEEWYWIEFEDGKVALSDVTCLFGGDTCWYHGNMDRLQEYAGEWRLRGTEDVAICDICWDNDGRNENAVERYIKWKYI